MQNPSEPAHSPTPEAIGKRIARLRSERGWTQQSLSARLAISRVAVSHIEMDLTFPSERTVILLAGLFKLSPFDLVEGTTYPQAKAERLPEIVCSYTQLEAELMLFNKDLTWLDWLAEQQQHNELLIEQTEMRRRITHLLQDWSARLSQFSEANLDEAELSKLSAARLQLIRQHEKFG